MDDPRIISTLVVLLVLTREVNSFGSGAPESVCESLMPSHGVPPQQSPPPYQVTTSNTFVTKGGQTSVTLSGSSPFMGFFVRARQNNKTIGGTFQQNDLGVLRCNNQGMTHSSSDPKFKLVVVWTAPADIQSYPMQFEATFVQQKQVFWTQVKSADITISLLASNDTSMNTETTTSSSFTLANPNSQDPSSAFPSNPTNPNIQQSNAINPANQNSNPFSQTNTNNLGSQDPNGFPQPNTNNQGFQDPNSLPQPNMPNSSFQGPNSNSQPPMTSSGFQNPNSFPQPNVTNSGVQDPNSLAQPGTQNLGFQDPNSSSQSGMSNSGFQDPNSSSQSGMSNSGFQGPNSSSQSGMSNSDFQGPNSSSQSGMSNSDFQGPNSSSQPGMSSSGFQGPNSFSQSGMSNSDFQGPNSSSQPGMSSSGFQGPNSSSQSGMSNSDFQGPNSSSQSGMSNSGFQGPNSSSQPGMSSSGFQDQNGFPQTNANNQMPQDPNAFPTANMTNPALQNSNADPQMNGTNPVQQNPNSFPGPNAANPIQQDQNSPSLGTTTKSTAGARSNNAIGQQSTTTSSTKMDTDAISGQNTTEDTVAGRPNSLAETGNGKLPLQGTRTINIDPDCGKSKGCYHNCQEGDSCSYFFSWTYETDQVHFEFLYHSSSSADQWIALGLSHDTVMGDDSVLECVADHGQVHVRTSYNNGKANEYPSDKSAAISDAKGSVTDGILACSFTRKSSYPEEKLVFDLSLPYYLMVATGEVVSGNKLPHSYQRLPKVSAEKVSLQQVVSISGSRNPFYPLVKAHGTIMTLAWMFFASCGLVIAKHGRSMFNNSKPFGIHVWFHIHRFCMVMTALLTILGCVLVVIESKGYSVIPETPGKAYRVLHPPLGLILVIVTLVNPLIALFRPDPKSPSRPVFRWSHWGIGIFAWAMSFVLIAIGLDLNKSQGEVEAIYVVFGFIAYQLFIDIVIRVTASFCGCFKSGCCESKHSYNINMEQISSNGLSRETTDDVSSDTGDTTKEDLKVQRGRNVTISIILVLHMVLSACFSIAVLYFFLRHPVGSLPSVPGQDGGKH